MPAVWIVLLPSFSCHGEGLLSACHLLAFSWEQRGSVRLWNGISPLSSAPGRSWQCWCPGWAVPRAELGLGTALQLLRTHGPELMQVYLAAPWFWDPWRRASTRQVLLLAARFLFPVCGADPRINFGGSLCAPGRGEEEGATHGSVGTLLCREQSQTLPVLFATVPPFSPGSQPSMPLCVAGLVLGAPEACSQSPSSQPGRGLLP